MLVFLHEVKHYFYTFSCGMLVYRDVTSAVTKRALSGKGESCSMRLRKFFVYLMCDGRLLARGWMKCLM